MYLIGFLKFMLYIPVSIFYPTKFIGKKNLPKGSAIMVSNHTANMDSILFAAHLKEHNYYLAKKELFSTKFKAWVIKGIGGIPIDRQTNDLGAIKQCLKVLKEGHKLVIYPEGTRNHNEDMEFGEVKGGATMLAIKGKVPIVPIYINRTPKLFKKVIVTIGQPFEFDEFYGQRLDSEALDKAGEKLLAKMKELRASCIERDNNTKKAIRKKRKAEKKVEKLRIKEEKKLSKANK